MITSSLFTTYPPGHSVDLSTTTDLYADGGIIGRNPSISGGTWAFCAVNEKGGVIAGDSGYLTPDEIGLPLVTNNLTECLAVLVALENMPEKWRGTLYSDSRNALVALACDGRRDYLPQAIQDRFTAALDRLGIRGRDQSTKLLKGHPTKADIYRGKTISGRPVSAHNVWCDRRCGIEAEKYRIAVSNGHLPTASDQVSIVAVVTPTGRVQLPA